VSTGVHRELTAYYRAHLAELPELERDRLERNVLRLPDSKDPRMAALNAAAPKITDRLCDACAEHFAGLRAHLDALGVGYRLEPGLVRGLDYYTRTTFEFYVIGREGQQQAIGGGGRYDGLVELLGGRPTPGIGFGIGIDRLILALAETGRRARRRRSPRRWRSSSAPTPRPPPRGSGSPRTCGRRGSRRGPISRIESSASSSRRPSAIAPTSR
jgi:histidyl-tRNA synthetase